MGNVTSSLIESAIQSASSDSDSTSARENLITGDSSSKLELYRLLRERMEDTSSYQKNPTSVGDDNSHGNAATAVAAPPKEHVMMAPKKKFLIGYRGDEQELASEKSGPGNLGSDVAKVSPTSSMLADVARSRSNTVSLPFRSRGPPQPEVPRRPLVESKLVDPVSEVAQRASVESKLVDAVSSAVTIRSCIVTAIDSRVGTPTSCATQPATPQLDTSTVRLKPHSSAVEMVSPWLQSASVGYHARPMVGVNVGAEKCQIQQQQRLTYGVSAMMSSHSPRSSLHYQRDSAGLTEPAASTRQMVQHARDRPEPGSRMLEPGARHMMQQISEPGVTGVKYDAIQPAVEHPVDRRLLPAGGTDRSPQFTVPLVYCKEAAADDRRRCGHVTLDHRDMKRGVGHDSYLSQVSATSSHYLDPHNTATERSVGRSHYIPSDTHSLPPDQTFGSYCSRSVDVARGWTGQHPSADSCRHVELPARDSRAGRPHCDPSDTRKYPADDMRMPAVDCGPSIVMPDLQYNRHQLREPMMVQPGAEHHYRRPAPHPTPLQPVEPSVRPRIAGLTHGDPSAYEAGLPQTDSSRYSTESAYRSGRYDLADRRRPSSDMLSPFVVPEQKLARRHSPYYSSSGPAWSTSGFSSGSVSLHGDTVARVTSESPLDLTVRKEQSMTAEAFLRRCHDSSQHSSQYSSPSRHATELQYSSFPSRRWTATRSDGFEASFDVRQQTPGTAGVLAAESSYPWHVTQRTGDAMRPGHSAVREYAAHPESDVRRVQNVSSLHHRRSDDDDGHILCSRRDAEQRWDSSRPPVSSISASPVVRPTYWDGRYIVHPIQTNTEMSENVIDSRTQHSMARDVGWIGERSQYSTRPVKVTDTDAPILTVDRHSHCATEIPLTSSPQNLPITAASRRVPMVQLLGGKYSPSDILHLCCKVCGSTYGSLRSFRMHFAKAHGQEPTPENFTIQTISDARIQAMSQRAQETTVEEDLPPTLQIESSVAAAVSVSRDVVMSTDADPHKRSVGVGEFSSSAPTKLRSVAEVQPIQKKSSPIYLDPGPPTPVSKSSPDEATKRCGEDRWMKCKKCGHFSTHDLSLLRQHVRSHGDAVAAWPTGACCCDCTDAVDTDAGCAVCLEGFNDVSDWKHHVTSQHMMRSCICKSCDLGFTNALVLRRHLTTTHGVQSPSSSNIEVEYRCLFCPEAFMDERSLYSHTRAHEQHYSAQRMCSRIRGSGVQTAIPDTTCPEDQRSTADVTSFEAAPASCTMESETAGKSTELETAKKNIEIMERGDVTAQKSSAAFDVRLNSKKASILRRLSADTELTSPATTSSTTSSLLSSLSSSSAGSWSVVKSVDDVETWTCRPQSHVVFGDLLSSMHREVESTLRQFTNDTATTSTSTPLTTVTLSSSACVRDVCDAIIVQALQQHDVTVQQTYTSSVTASLEQSDSLETQPRVSDSETCMIGFNPQSQVSQSELPINSEQTSRLTDSTQCSQPNTQQLTDPSMSESQLTGSTSRLTDAQSRLIDPQSRLSDFTSQVTDLKNKPSESEATDRERHNEQDECAIKSRLSDRQSQLSDSEWPVQDQLLSDVLTDSTTTCTTATAVAEADADLMKCESDVAADDVDMEDQPLCIDLNRDLSPDDTQSAPTPHTNPTTTY